MIKNYLPLIALIVFSLNSFAQEKLEKLTSPIITSMTLTANTIYLVSDEILVSNGAILTIEEGVELKNQTNHETIIIIDDGSKVIASGSYENPIIASTTTNTQAKPIIVMKSPESENKNALAKSNFHYNSIQNPIILLNPTTLINTEISSVQGDF